MSRLTRVSLTTPILLAITSSLFAQTQFQGLSRATFPGSNGGTFDIATGDVDLNGTVDAVLVHFQGTVDTQLLLNDGEGNFTDATATHLPAGGIGKGGAVELVDVDFDLDLDLLMGVGGSGVKLLQNDGTGKFTDVSATHMPSTFESAYHIVTGDIDFDLDPDIVVANPGVSAMSRLFVNDGTGKFTDVTGTAQFPAVTGGRHWGAAMADVDGDVDLDIVFTSSSATAPPLIYINTNGFGTFADESSTRLPTISQPGRKVLIADFDKDGDNDIFFGNFGVQDRMLENNGLGIFRDVTSTRLPTLSNGTYMPAHADIDDDGDLDILVGCWASNGGTQNNVLLNDGSGVFSDATASRIEALSDETTALALADFDCDGDVDALVGNWLLPSRVLFNLHRHLYAPAQATINTTYDIDFYSAPGYGTLPHPIVFGLFAGTLGNKIELKPWRGYLTVDPGLMVGNFLSATVLSATGKTTVQIPIPNIPSLANLTFWVQGIVTQLPGGTGFTNAMSDTVK